MSAIEWTDRTWNPIVGCSRVSPGCEHCYAERFVHRELAPQHRGLTVLGKQGPRWTGEVRLVENRLGEPLRWKKPARVFVNSLSDLFHEQLSNEQIAAVFGVMAACPHLTFQVLTKRPERMRAWFSWIAGEGDEVLGMVGETPDGHDGQIAAACAMYAKETDCGGVLTRDGFRNACQASWPLPNVWLGVTAEDQQRADERIPHLLDTPAAKRFVSYEPALGEIDLGLSSATCDCCPRWSSRWVLLHDHVQSDEPFAGAPPSMVARAGVYRASSNRHGALSVRTSGGLLGIKPDEFTALPALDWVIVGGESGPGARPFDIAWARSAIEQCREAGVPVFVKQLGASPQDATRGYFPNNLVKLVHRKGADPNEWPEDLRVREFPR